MQFSEAEIAAFIQQYFLPFARISAMFMVMPVLGSRTVSPRVRLVLAFFVTLIAVPLMPKLAHMDSLSLASFLIVIQEVIVGLVVGFSFQVVFQVFILTGQIMAMKMGLGFASMNDPTNGVQTTALSQFFLMLVTLMFVSVDGHMVLIKLLLESFVSLPPGTWFLNASFFQSLSSLASWMFSAALIFSLPVLTSLLIVNIAFGVMSRAAPQLNIFAVGFPFTLVVGLMLVWFGLTNFVSAFEDVMAYGLFFLEDLLRIN
ncbi:flagellar biosynthetic protein FliR [Agarilytica rhodophyticola]|uniref:flagellar biosynthetic protein FliR n=1 Tax=Agarilytica rhodophyticola TaxID=1737490 RepID=UPI000B34821E|nr:flagellar biosynthetic protein FliR [Agarilytica rhodophyticola]